MVALLRLGRNAEAVADLETAVEIAPEDAPTQVNLGLALFELGGQHERAIAALTAAVANHGLDGATAVAAHVALAKLLAEIWPDAHKRPLLIGNDCNTPTRRTSSSGCRCSRTR